MIGKYLPIAIEIFSYSLLVIKFHVNLTGLKLVLIWWQRRMIWLVPACKFHFLQIAIKGNFSFLKYIYLRFISIVRKFENLSTIFLLAYSSRHSIWVPWIKKCLRQVEQGFSQFLQKKYVNIISRFFNVSQPIWLISLNEAELLHYV